MNWDSIKRVSGYVVVTAAISIIGQLDSMGFEFSKLSINMCIGMVLKSLLPGLVSIKALFDDSLTTDKSEEVATEDVKP